MKLRNKIILGVAALFAVGIIGCSSKGGDSGTIISNGTNTTGGNNNNGSPITTSKITIGSMTKGSVILNGVHFDDTNATVIADDTAKTTAFLADGMTVKVKGTVNADGRTGTAEKVEVVSEARGGIASIGTDTLLIHGQTVLVDGGTVLAPAGVTGLTGTSPLLANDSIEVHGGRDDTGVIHATRVEKLAAGPVVNEVRGVVSGKAGTTFNIGGLTITSDATTTLVPSGAAFNNGDIVQVRLNGGTAATQIAVEHLDHPEFEPAQGGELSVQGIISGFTSTTSSFKTGSQQVQIDANATIIGGVFADLIDGVKVEAEGHTTTGGLLTVTKITINDNIRFEGNAATAGDASMLGKTVAMTSGTRFSGGLTSGATITTGDGLQVRGFINRDGQTITSTRVTKLGNPVAANKMIIQGPVTSKDSTARSLVILGTTIDASGASAIDKNTGLPAGTVDQIFTSTTAGATIIKARGTVSGSTMTATEIEIE